MKQRKNSNYQSQRAVKDLSTDRSASRGLRKNNKSQFKDLFPIGPQVESEFLPSQKMSMQDLKGHKRQKSTGEYMIKSHYDAGSLHGDEEGYIKYNANSNTASNSQSIKTLKQKTYRQPSNSNFVFSNQQQQEKVSAKSTERKPIEYKLKIKRGFKNKSKNFDKPTFQQLRGGQKSKQKEQAHSSVHSSTPRQPTDRRSIDNRMLEEIGDTPLSSLPNERSIVLDSGSKIGKSLESIDH